MNKIQQTFTYIIDLSKRLHESGKLFHIDNEMEEPWTEIEDLGWILREVLEELEEMRYNIIYRKIPNAAAVQALTAAKKIL